MRLLLDTHVIIWIAQKSRKLGRRSRAMMEAGGGVSAISTITLYEIGNALRRGRLDDARLSVDQLRRQFRDAGIDEIDVTGDIAKRATELRSLHDDPADRLIIATALVDDRTLVTADSRILDWPGKLVRHDATT